MATPLAHDDGWLLVAAAVASVLAVGRLTRLAVYDKYPPAMRVRDWYVSVVPERWAGLATCPFCFAPWAQLVSLSWAWVGGLNPETLSGGLWWFAHLWFALAYAASMVVVRDQPIEYDDDDDDDSDDEAVND